MPSALAAKIRNAGAIFLGATRRRRSATMSAGSNHVLPTARSARFSSGLGVLDFMKRTSILRLEPMRSAARARRDRARRGRRARRPCALGRDAAQPQMSDAGEQRLDAAPRRGHARRRLDRPLQSGHRARARGRDLRPDRGQFVRAGRSRRRAVRAASRRSPRTGWCSTSASEDGTPVMAHLLSLTPFRKHREGLLHDLRQLLRGDPHRDAEPDRGDRHGPARAARRRLANCCRSG